MTDPLANPPTVARRWPRYLLIASLAFNALLIGVIIRGLWIARANFAMGGGAIEASIPAFVATLPQPRREELRRGIPPDRPVAVLRPLRMEVRRARADAARAFLADPFDKQAFIANLHALKRTGRPDELARAALFLASDDAAFVTGTAMLVDGGVSITRT